MAGNLEKLTCPKCGGTLELRAKGFTNTLVCSYCGTISSLSDQGLTITAAIDIKNQVTPAIALGSRGKLHGALWEVIGFMVRRGLPSLVTWREYLLFNPYKGFRWLTECNGHWNYVVTLHDVPKYYPADEISYLNQDFTFYEAYDAKVLYVAGEFYWRVQTDDLTRLRDYVSVPNILTLESTADEQIWSFAEYTEPQTIQTAFQPETPLPERFGTVNNQPYEHNRDLSVLSCMALMSAIVAVIIFLFFLFTGNVRVLMRDQVAVTEQGAEVTYSTNYQKEYISHGFSINNEQGLLAFSLRAPVNNSWLEAKVTLINDKTGKALNFDTGLEYYYGYDSDGYWTDGNQSKTLVFSAQPTGDYHLVMSLSANQPTAMIFDLKQGVQSWSNLWLTLFLLFLPLIVVVINYFYFEYNRQNS